MFKSIFVKYYLNKACCTPKRDETDVGDFMTSSHVNSKKESSRELNFKSSSVNK
jgi:hypothetical protein